MNAIYKLRRAVCVVAVSSVCAIAFAADTAQSSSTRDDCTRAEKADAKTRSDCTSVQAKRTHAGSHRDTASENAADAAATSNPAARGSSSIQQNSASTGSVNVPVGTSGSGR